MIYTKEQIIEYFKSGIKQTKDFKIGITDKPNSVSEYSTFGGTTWWTFLLIMPSVSSSLSCLDNICWVIVFKPLLRILNLTICYCIK